MNKKPIFDLKGEIIGQEDIPKPTPMVKPKEPSLSITRDDVLAKWEEWLKDETHLKAVESLGIEWLGPGFIIEIFAPDFSDMKSKLVSSDGFYFRVSPYARVLSASPENEGPRGKLKPGDIIYLGDAAANVKKNPEWERWAMAGKSSGKLENKEPIQWIRSVHSWVQQGRLFFTDKAAYLGNNDLVQMDEQRMKIFQGPYVFEVEPNAVRPIRITNPWG